MIPAAIIPLLVSAAPDVIDLIKSTIQTLRDNNAPVPPEKWEELNQLVAASYADRKEALRKELHLPSPTA